jgi:hypothetical protein
MHDSGDLWCEYCAEEYAAVCDGCRETVEYTTHVYGSEEYLCGGCVDSSAHECDRCGEFFDEESIYHPADGEEMCMPCIEQRGGGYCTNCEELIVDLRYFPDHESWTGELVDGGMFCEDCVREAGHWDWEDGQTGDTRRRMAQERARSERRSELGYSENAVRCSLCGNDSHYYVEDRRNQGLVFCTDRCMTKDDGHQSGFRYKVLNYTFKPPPQFRDMPSELARNKLYFGTETEVTTESSVNTVLSQLTDEDDERLFYVKSDSSINGIEVVSHPFTYDWMVENEGCFSPIFLMRKFGVAHDNQCGMHIHMSVSAFSRLHKMKFSKLFFENETFMFSMSRRTRKEWKRWGGAQKFNDGFSAMSIAQGSTNPNRSSMLNFQRRDTIECRMFRGTISPSGYFGNIEMLKAAYDYTKSAGINDMTPGRFIEFAHDHGSMYKNFLFMHDNSAWARAIEE